MSRITCISLAVLLFSGCVSSGPAMTPVQAGWAVSARGAGPVIAGMSIEEASEALGRQIPAPAYDLFDHRCDYAELPGAPAGLLAMVVDDTVVRVDVDSMLVATVSGARVGDPESRILRLYAGRVKVEPHAYTDGRYLVVTPAHGDSTFRLIFETYAGRVTRFRAGRMPEVAWMEGCA